MNEKIDSAALAAVGNAEPVASDAASHVVPTFTPGQWRIGLAGSFIDGKPSAGVFLEAGDFHTLACLMPVPEVEANAHLISAAPELYEALKAVLGQFDAGYFVRNINDDHKPDWAIRAARSVRALAQAQQALAKAEGRDLPSAAQKG